MLKFFPILSVIVLLVFLSTTISAARPQYQRQQLLDKRVQNREQESDDLDDGGDKEDLKGSASYGYGYYGYPFGGYGGYGGGLYSGGLYGGGIYPYGYSLHSGYYGGYSPYYGGYGYPGHYF